MTNKWFAISSSDPCTTEVMIYDDIGAYGVSAKDFVSEFKAIKTPKISVRLNTMGGSVFDGLAIYNAIDQSDADVTVSVDGIAASIGSIIALAGDRCIMAANSFMMIHNAWSYVQGNASAMRQEADILDKLDADIAAIYAKKTGKTTAELGSMMAKETWMNADDAKGGGFADEVSGDAGESAVSSAAAKASARFARVPDRVRMIAAAFNAAVVSADAERAKTVALGKAAIERAKKQIEMDERAVLA